MNKRCDYKPVIRRQQRHSVRIQGAVVLGLVVIALGSGLVVHLRSRTAPVAHIDHQIDHQNAVAASIPTPAAPLVEKAPAATDAVIAPKYNFYTELPKRQVAVP